ncbi:MAG: LytR C-terminal domain-containing protein [Desulfobacca sp.]|nr:LytR C-terminal domain-containing protein [Desulfobacca sp.]
MSLKVLNNLKKSIKLAIILLLGLTLGDGCSTRSPHNASLRDFSAQVRPYSRNLNRHQQNAHYLKLIGKPELAVQELEAALQQDPDNLKVLNTLARTYDEGGEFERAQALYQRGLDQHGDNPALLNNLGFSYYLSGNYQQADSCFRRALAQQPEDSLARNNLGLSLCRQGRLEEARQLWEEREGPTQAQEKLQEVLTALGMPVPQHYAQQALPRPVSGPIFHEPLVAPQSTSPKTVAQKTADPVSPEPEKPRSPAPEPSKTAETASLPPVVAAPPGKPKTVSQKSLVPVLTASELIETAIDIRNGNGIPDLAHDTRTKLSLEGFNVVAIVNHLDFGMEKTTIYYRPGKEKVAQALNAKFFPVAQVEQSQDLPARTDIKVILGHDLDQRETYLTNLAKLASKLKSIATPAPSVQQSSISPDLKTAKVTAPVESASQAHTTPEKDRIHPPPSPVKSTPLRHSPLAVAPPASIPKTIQQTSPVPVLTASELIKTAIDIRNGSGTPNIARATRTLLALEGFNVVSIANHLDFGKEKTTIYYRPGKERVAQVLNAKFFPVAQLEQSLSLSGWTDIKIILGHDLASETSFKAGLAQGLIE